MTVPIRQHTILTHEFRNPEAFQFILQHKMTLPTIQRRKEVPHLDDFTICKLDDEIVAITHHASDPGSSHPNLDD